jgi:hypothetical protein
VLINALPREIRDKCLLRLSRGRGVVVDEAQRLGSITGPDSRDLGTKARSTEMGGGGYSSPREE